MSGVGKLTSSLILYQSGPKAEVLVAPSTLGVCMWRVA